MEIFVSVVRLNARCVDVADIIQPVRSFHISAFFSYTNIFRLRALAQRNISIIAHAVLNWEVCTIFLPA